MRRGRSLREEPSQGRAARQSAEHESRVSRRGALALLGSALVSCITDPPPSRPARARVAELRHGPVIVLLAIDGVRSQEMFGGVSPERAARFGVAPALPGQLTPNLARIGETSGCVLGAPEKGEGFFASGPDFVSLPGYSEMLTGSRDSGCATNLCKNVRRPTLLDDFVRAHGGDERAAVIGSWPRIESASSLGKKSGIVSTGRTGGYHQERFARYAGSRRAFDAGRKAAPAPGYGDYRPDHLTAELALAYLAEARPTFLFVSLGETDEHAHENRYGDYLTALRFADDVVGRIERQLRELAREGVPTALFVTTDHGRAEQFTEHGAKWPESSRSFLFATGTMIRARGRVEGGRAHLADIAPTVRALAGLSPRTDEASGRVLDELLIDSSIGMARL